MALDDRCVVCKTECKVLRDDSQVTDSNKYECAQCGSYIISDEAAAELRLANLPIGLVSGAFSRMAPRPPRINSETIKKLKQLQMPSFGERVDAYLLALAESAPKLDEQVSFLQPSLIAVAHCGSLRELETIARHLEAEAMIKPVALGSGVAHILPKGRTRADSLRAHRAASSQGLIVMWINDEMEQARRTGLEPGIRNAGYQPHRAHEEHHVDKIDDRIIADIRKSRFLVADLTGHRHGVYYVAGLARGLDRPIFYTCREDHKDGIPFDIHQFDCIIWKDPAQLAKILQGRIEAEVGLGAALTAV